MKKQTYNTLALALMALAAMPTHARRIGDRFIVPTKRVGAEVTDKATNAPAASSILRKEDARLYTIANAIPDTKRKGYTVDQWVAVLKQSDPAVVTQMEEKLGLIGQSTRKKTPAFANDASREKIIDLIMNSSLERSDFSIGEKFKYGSEGDMRQALTSADNAQFSRMFKIWKKEQAKYQAKRKESSRENIIDRITNSSVDRSDFSIGKTEYDGEDDLRDALTKANDVQLSQMLKTWEKDQAKRKQSAKNEFVSEGIDNKRVLKDILSGNDDTVLKAYLDTNEAVGVAKQGENALAALKAINDPNKAEAAAGVIGEITVANKGVAAGVLKALKEFKASTFDQGADEADGADGTNLLNGILDALGLELLPAGENEEDNKIMLKKKNQH